MSEIPTPPGARAIPGFQENLWQTRVAQAAKELSEVRDELNRKAMGQDEPDIVLGTRIEFLNDALLSLQEFLETDDEIRERVSE